MRKSSVALRLQPSLLDEVCKVAEAEGVSVNQFITVAVAEKLSALRTEDDVRERAARASATRRSRATNCCRRRGGPSGIALPPVVRSIPEAFALVG